MKDLEEIVGKQELLDMIQELYGQESTTATVVPPPESISALPFNLTSACQQLPGGQEITDWTVDEAVKLIDEISEQCQIFQPFHCQI